MDETKIIVGITHGDYNGVGYEIIIKALEDPAILELCTPVIYGSPKIAGHYRKMLEIQPITHTVVEQSGEIKHGTVNFVNVIGEDVTPEPGKPGEKAGASALAALERATADLKSGKIDVLVTAPINKATIQCPEFQFPGHTEYLEAALAESGEKAMMIMADDNGLRVALATTHLPVAKVAEALTAERVEERIRAFNRALMSDFGIHAPRIAVLGLNPHSGDAGLLGKEEQEIIAPAIEKAKADHILAYGPYSADGFFGQAHHRAFDGILAMYHDQGLIPFKTLCGNHGVNITAGLPYVRTSPDHGTAYDIAGKGEADATSMRQAIYTAIDAFRNRARHNEAYANPLKKLYQDRGRDN